MKENIKKPTKEQIIEHYKSGVGEICLVCNSDLLGNWTDYNGQIRCHNCGTTYQVLGSHLKDEFLKDNGLTKDDVAKRYCDCFEDLELLKAYREETENKIPYGTFLIDRVIPETEYTNFYKWVWNNRERLADWKDDFKWEIMEKKFSN